MFVCKAITSLSTGIKRSFNTVYIHCIRYKFCFCFNSKKHVIMQIEIQKFKHDIIAI